MTFRKIHKKKGSGVKKYRHTTHSCCFIKDKDVTRLSWSLLSSLSCIYKCGGGEANDVEIKIAAE